MPVTLARIDDRLIHGQVTEGWARKLAPDHILVVSDEIAETHWYCDLCLASLPKCYKGMVSVTGDAPRIINELVDQPYDSFVLFASPKDAYTAVKNGARLETINVGGMHTTSKKREVLHYLYLDEEDIRYLKGLAEMGVKLDFRDLPEHENIDVLSRL